MSKTESERQRRAIAAAQSIATYYGIDGDHPTILQDSNHTVIHLAPAPLVAKVNTSPEEASLTDEVTIAQFLAAMDGLVVPPTSLLPPARIWLADWRRASGTTAPTTRVSPPLRRSEPPSGCYMMPSMGMPSRCASGIVSIALPGSLPPPPASRRSQ
jgi:hypothetical protein